MSKTRVANHLAEIRKGRGIGAAELAEGVGVSRQTIYAMEAGTYVPNTEVALKLARELEVTVDQLFALQGAPSATLDPLRAEVLSPVPATKGQPMRICRVGEKWVGIPASATPYYMPQADGVVERTTTRAGVAELVAFAHDDGARKRLVLAGCDPATSLLSAMVEKASGLEIVSAAASSRLALTWLNEGKVHIAGSHLEDAKTGEFNLPFIRKQYPGADFRVVIFARWEEGFVTAQQNPKGIRKVADLARKNVRFVNREPGSGSRGLLDRLLNAAGIAAENVRGYERTAWGHLAAAYCVLAGDADVCLATRSAAQAFGLHFTPLHSERYDLVMKKETAELPAVQIFLDVLQRAALRRKLEVLAGYDTAQTGTIMA